MQRSWLKPSLNKHLARLINCRQRRISTDKQMKADADQDAELIAKFAVQLADLIFREVEPLTSGHLRYTIVSVLMCELARRVEKMRQ